MVWNTTQPSLLLRLRSPEDEGAWALFNRRYGGLIVNYACRRGLELHDAEDVRQIVLMNLLRAFETFELNPEKGRFRSYLGRVVGNAIQRYRQRPYRSREVLELDREILLTLPDPQDQDDVWEKEWVSHHLRLAMRTVRKTFDPRSVDVFDQFLQGRDTAQIADEMEMSIDAVHKVKQRIRNRLKELVQKQVQEEGELA